MKPGSWRKLPCPVRVAYAPVDAQILRGIYFIAIPPLGLMKTRGRSIFRARSVKELIQNRERPLAKAGGLFRLSK